MKQITNKTILVQGDKTFQPIKVDGVIYWVDDADIKEGDHYYNHQWQQDLGNGLFKRGVSDKMSINDKKVISQSSLKLEGIPVINIYSPIQQLLTELKETFNNCLPEFKTGIQHAVLRTSCYLESDNQYTLKDIEEAIKLAKKRETIEGISPDFHKFTSNEIVEQINSISIINIDEQFNIISYE